MENSKKRTFRVGIFLAIGVFVVMASIVLLGGDKAFLKRNIYMYTLFDQVQGLDRGSIVSLSGITVGNIAKIEYSPEKKSMVVQMKIQEDYLPLITVGSKADVRTQGALGDKFIYISPGAPGPHLDEGATIEAAQSSDIMGIISEKGGDASGKVFDIINEVYRLAKIINADGRSEKIMSNFVEASQNMKTLSDDARKIISEMRGQDSAKLKQALVHLDSVLAKIDHGDGTLGALINDPALHERLKTVLGVDTHRQSTQSIIRTSIQKSGN